MQEYESKIQVIKPKNTFTNDIKKLIGLKKLRSTNTYDFSNIQNAQKATEKDGNVKIVIQKKTPSTQTKRKEQQI